jgi:hypothetical protein
MLMRQYLDLGHFNIAGIVWFGMGELMLSCVTQCIISVQQGLTIWKDLNWVGKYAMVLPFSNSLPCKY